uniref:Uncharacterized protein n=1 Tax=Lotharella globosa TaxID=91324 RepID=A0A7S4DWA4_9EUKA|mmetsp:Transcript_16269/g.32978  ORF Transcript_16269/g.32978 Transcript_16269/m.32978 type:complete len:796 (-) Transcript_16269:102-2489(-)|eukprot:CAMPEP_0167820582 /NCGR_PEP_ID=MMETSP0112_2-20121227/6190_1 /TAXON_ID=91324 /ORGANISM="Lotharella globosa, Strain CCCM811" /LENGTH=795 /DNA_ID=CAMNT_0007721193 /DNA_START=62 /DNA_END=2449 /DNA_ORIENTATION=-
MNHYDVREAVKSWSLDHRQEWFPQEWEDFEKAIIDISREIDSSLRLTKHAIACLHDFIHALLQWLLDASVRNHFRMAARLLRQLGVNPTQDSLQVMWGSEVEGKYLVSQGVKGETELRLMWLSRNEAQKLGKPVPLSAKEWENFLKDFPPIGELDPSRMPKGTEPGMLMMSEIAVILAVRDITGDSLGDCSVQEIDKSLMQIQSRFRSPDVKSRDLHEILAATPDFFTKLSKYKQLPILVVAEKMRSYLRTLHKGLNFTPEAAASVTAVLTCITVDILERAGNCCTEVRVIRPQCGQCDFPSYINRRHLLLAVGGDEELSDLFMTRGEIIGAGRIPHIPTVCVKVRFEDQARSIPGWERRRGILTCNGELWGDGRCEGELTMMKVFGKETHWYPFREEWHTWDGGDIDFQREDTAQVSHWRRLKDLIAASGGSEGSDREECDLPLPDLENIRVNEGIFELALLQIAAQAGVPAITYPAFRRLTQVASFHLKSIVADLTRCSEEGEEKVIRAQDVIELGMTAFPSRPARWIYGTGEIYKVLGMESERERRDVDSKNRECWVDFSNLELGLQVVPEEEDHGPACVLCPKRWIQLFPGEGSYDEEEKMDHERLVSEATTHTQKTHLKMLDVMRRVQKVYGPLIPCQVFYNLVRTFHQETPASLNDRPSRCRWMPMALVALNTQFEEVICRVLRTARICALKQLQNTNGQFGFARYTLTLADLELGMRGLREKLKRHLPMLPMLHDLIMAATADPHDKAHLGFGTGAGSVRIGNFQHHAFSSEASRFPLRAAAIATSEN